MYLDVDTLLSPPSEVFVAANGLELDCVGTLHCVIHYCDRQCVENVYICANVENIYKRGIFAYRLLFYLVIIHNLSIATQKTRCFKFKLRLALKRPQTEILCLQPASAGRNQETQGGTARRLQRRLFHQRETTRNGREKNENPPSRRSKTLSTHSTKTNTICV